MSSTRDRGFTLIELLIVIAIILILIAIALPNFLEAQIRARVTAAQGDMRSTATALEAYSVDWRGKYPWAAALDDLSVPIVPPEEAFEGYLSAALTSPVAYMADLPVDPFTNFAIEGDADESVRAPFHYNEQESLTRMNEPALFPLLSIALFGQIRSGVYYIFSHGPDADHDESLDHTEPGFETVRYSPTNGTKSSGDIYYWSGAGFN